MTTATCSICKTIVEVAGELRSAQVLVPLSCGHIYNWITGDSYASTESLDYPAIMEQAVAHFIGEQKMLREKSIEAFVKYRIAFVNIWGSGW